MSTSERPLLGSVFERTTPGSASAPSSRFSGTPGIGFPIAQHRFKSAFGRARDANATGNGGRSRRIGVPAVVSADTSQARALTVPATSIVDQTPNPTDINVLRRQIHEENSSVVARMSEEQIEQEKRAILEQLGEGTEELLRRVQTSRRRKEAKESDVQAAVKETAQEAPNKAEGTMDNTNVCKTTNHGRVPLVVAPTPRRVSDGLASRPGILRVKSLDNIGRSVPSPLPAMSSTRPSSRTGRKLRFAEVTPDDVHVYESAPISPKRAVLALPPPPDAKDDSIISLGTFRKSAILAKKPRQADDSPIGVPMICDEKDNEPEEGTPEYIRQQYFPHIPANDPNLSWMNMPSQEETDPSAPRFDLHGTPIPVSLSASLPSHLGLHHHAEGSRAGYTIDDIFLLARSTMPAQRASMLGILAKIAGRLSRQVQHPDSAEKIDAFAGQESQLRKRILAAGLVAVDQIGSLGARSIEVVWECLVNWDGMGEVEGVELALAPDVVSSLELDYLLPRIADVLSHSALPPESLTQLLDIVHWCAQQSNQVADMVTATPRLVPTIISTFLLTPIPPKEDSVPPNPIALQLLITLASASRTSASVLLDPADALLRFVTPLPPSSPFSPALAIVLLVYMLRFCATLSSYGFYSHIATTASEVFTALGSYVLPHYDSTNLSGSAPRQLCTAWASLVEVWTVCATDPHGTSPPHEILWSQVRAWGWTTDIRKLREGLGNERPDWTVYVAIWDVEAAWLEGARINGVKGGTEEREEALQILRNAFDAVDGVEFGIVQRALEVMQHSLKLEAPGTTRDGERVLRSVSSVGSVVASALRLWSACLPPLDDGVPLSTPPFMLPFSDLSALSAMLIKHPIWSLPSALGAAHLRVHLRPLTHFIIHFHRVSRYIPGTNPQLWFAQALVFLSRLLPGDESHALGMLDAFLLVTPQFVGLESVGLPQGIHMDVLRPFFQYTVRPEKDVYVAPLRPSTESILRSSTLRLLHLPSSPSLGPGSDDGHDDPSVHQAHTLAAGLPLTCDFLFTPLAHLLRSGTSPVFRTPPNDWTAGEVDIVRATLLLAYAARRVLVAHGLEAFVHSAAEVAFACMQVCMLEHGVGSGDTDMDVFRDPAVERLMALLLEPFTVRGCSSAIATVAPPHTGVVYTLEEASAPYLGPTPFYQFYTDLVALYGAVSFGHRTFAALVVTPLAMQYAVDYRRALWCGEDRASSGSGAGDNGGVGLGDVVRSVHIPIEDVICTAGRSDGKRCEDPREYLYPIEQDIGVLGAYVAALVARDGAGVDGFLRLVAVHHVACTVWADLDRNGNVDADTILGECVSGVEDEATTRSSAYLAPTQAEVDRRSEVRTRLLRAVIMRGEPAVARDVVLYRQRHPRETGTFVWPPRCYEGGGGGEDDEGPVAEDTAGSGSDWRKTRLEFVRRACGEQDVVTERVGTLLCAHTTES